MLRHNRTDVSGAGDEAYIKVKVNHDDYHGDFVEIRVPCRGMDDGMLEVRLQVPYEHLLTEGK